MRSDFRGATLIECSTEASDWTARSLTSSTGNAGARRVLWKVIPQPFWPESHELKLRCFIQGKNDETLDGKANHARVSWHAAHKKNKHSILRGRRLITPPSQPSQPLRHNDQIETIINLKAASKLLQIMGAEYIALDPLGVLSHCNLAKHIATTTPSSIFSGERCFSPATWRIHEFDTTA